MMETLNSYLLLKKFRLFALSGSGDAGTLGMSATSHRAKLSLLNICVSGDGRIYKNVLTLP